jgi:hypothetical protein
MAANMAIIEEEPMGASFKDLVVWQRAVDLSVEIYRLTATFPTAERFGLTDQLRRASVSIASNIAEDYGRATRGNICNFSVLQGPQIENCRPSSSFPPNSDLPRRIHMNPLIGSPQM